MGIHTERRRYAQEEILKHVLVAILAKGQDKIVITRESLEDEMWRDLVIKIVEDQDTNSWTVHLSHKHIRPPVADYEIVHESPALPSPQKLLPRATPDK